jgi:hypothetical protein
MTRSIDGQRDHSNYMRSFHGAYYACSGKNAGYYYFRNTKGPTPAKPEAPAMHRWLWLLPGCSTHTSHEFRLTTNKDYASVACWVRSTGS